MKVFSGSSNPTLARKIAKSLNLGLAKVELSQFPNNEIRIRIKERVVNQEVLVVQSLSTPPERHLVELCLLVDALERLEPKKIIAVIPWLAYTKQDKVFQAGEPLSAKVIAKLIQSGPVGCLMTFDLHNLAMIGFFDIPVIHLMALPVLEEKLKKEASEQSLVVSIGAGGTKPSASLARDLNLPLVYLDTERDLRTGKVTVRGISRSVAGKEVLVIDDMIATGSTLIQASDFLKKQKAKKVTIAATHHLFIPGVAESLGKSKIDRLFVTDTVKKPPGLKLKKTKIVSVASIVANAVKKMLK